MARKFDKRGWNRQFKWQPLRTDRWDPFPKDRLPFVDDFSIGNYQYSKKIPPRRDFIPETPQQQRPQGAELISPAFGQHVPWDTPWNNRIGSNRIIPEHHNFGFMP